MKRNFVEKSLPWNEILKEAAFSKIEDKYTSLFLGGVLQCKNGSLQTTFEFTGGDYRFERGVLKKRRDTISEFLSSLLDNYTFYFTVSREHSPFAYISFEDEMSLTAKEIEKRRKALFLPEKMFINKTYVTLSYSPLKAGSGISELQFQEYIETLASLHSTLLSIDGEASVLKNDELLSFLRSEVTLSNENTLLPYSQKNLDISLLTSSLSLSSIPLVIKNDDKEMFVRCISFNDLPSNTYPDMLQTLYSIPFQFKTVAKYIAKSKESSEKALVQRRKQYKSSIFSITDYMKAEFKGSDVSASSDARLKAVHGRDECTNALELMAKANVNIGYFSLSILVYSEDEKLLDERIGYLKNTLGKMGFLTKVEGIGNSLLFFSSIAGYESTFRSKMMLSLNYADMLHLSSVYSGARESALIKKRFSTNAPLIYAKNLDGSPYYFSLSGRHGEKGHTFISGPTGSGKSVFLALLIASYLKFKNARVVVIDRDLSSLNIVIENGGKLYYPLFDKTHFKPLSSKKRERSQSLIFLRSVCIGGKIEYNADVEEDASAALSLLTKGHESISNFYALLKGINKNSPLLTALLPYIKGGAYENLFDSEEESLDDFSNITLIETNRILQGSSNDLQGVQVPTMIHILSRLERAFSDSVPTLLIMDEAWKFLKNETFKNYLEEWIKTLRKKNVDIVFSITNTADIIGTSIAETVLSNTETRIFMSDKTAGEALERRNYESIGLGDKEIELLVASPRFCPLIIQDGTVDIVDFELDNQLEFLVTTEEMKREFLCDNE